MRATDYGDALDGLRGVVTHEERGYVIRLYKGDAIEPLLERDATPEEARMLRAEIWPSLQVGQSATWNLGRVGRIEDRA